MTAHIVPLYGASLLTIGMLVLFARHNRKNGWRKQKSSFSQFLGGYYQEQTGGRTDSRAENEKVELEGVSIPSWTPVTAAETIGFSAQLLNLRTALGTGAVTPSFQTDSKAHDLVRK